MKEIVDYNASGPMVNVYPDPLDNILLLPV